MSAAGYKDIGVANHRGTDAPGTDEAGWVERDPVRAAAIALILSAVIIRIVIASHGFLAYDDYALTGRSATHTLTPGYTVELFNNHLMPGGVAVTWVITHTFGLVYLPYVLLMAVAELVLGVIFYRLLRNIIGTGWRLLPPLAILMFSPLTLEVTSWWAVGANMLPMQIAIVLALGAMYKYVQAGRRRHLASLAAAVLFGLLFFEKSLLIAPLVFITTACLFVSGGPARSVITAVRRYWPAWLVLALIGGGYLTLYLTLASSSLRDPGSADAVLTFLGQISASTLAAGLVGGPWLWLFAGDGAPVAAPPTFGAALAVIVVLSVIGMTMAFRPRAGRAWAMAVLYIALVSGLLASTRLGGFTKGVEGLAPRYIADAVPVVALALGVALFGSANASARPVRGPVMPRGFREGLPVLVVIGVLGIGAGTAYTFTGWTNLWSIKAGREYLHTAEADLAKAPPGTVFFDEAVPTDIVGPLSYPETMQSHFFAPLKHPPTFVTETPRLSMFDSSGHIRDAAVTGHRVQPAEDKGCGYRVTGGAVVSMPLDSPIFDWVWAIRIAYIASAETTATLRLGTYTHQFPIHTGLNQYYFQISGGGDSIQLTVADRAVTLCTNEISIGNLVPK